MATNYKTTLQESAKDRPQDRETAAQKASTMSQSIQRKFGSPSPVVATPEQRAAAEGKASQASYAQREKFVPQAYKAISDIESASTGVQDQSAQFWANYADKARALEEQQRQGTKGTDLFLQQANEEMLQKLQEMDFTAYKNAAQRHDALEKAYLDGSLQETLIQAGINHDIRMQDISKVRSLIMNSYQEMLAEFRLDEEINAEKIKANMEATSILIGSIMSGIASMAGA